MGNASGERHSLAAAIRVSTERLAEVDPDALALVRVGAFLAPEPIPADVLSRPVPTTGDRLPPELEALTVAVTSPVAAHRSLGRVGSYGLARIVASAPNSAPRTLPLIVPMPRRCWSRRIQVTEQTRPAGRAGHGSCPTCWPPIRPPAPALNCGTWPARPPGTSIAEVMFTRPVTWPSISTSGGVNSSEQTTGTPCGSL
ncbi:MAG: hypothetical protein ACRDSL_01600 [Pseudonocardiaceae bacterium]